MKSIRFFDRRVGSSLAAIGMLLGLVVPAAVPAFASADVLETRSMAMSSSVADATGVTYEFSFNPTSAFQSLAVDFCTNSPILGEACTAPTGLNVGTTFAFTTGSIGTITTTGSTASAAVISGTAPTANANAVVFTMSGVHNPTAAESFYARIYTYATTENYTDAETVGTHVDDGAVAVSTTDAIGISAAVRETLTFCVSAAEPTAACGGTTAPSLELGEGTPKALVTGTVSTAGIYSQLSTNASSGAIVKMTNSTGCGGLKRVGESGNVCAIQPQGALAAITTNQTDGKFGVRVGTPAGVSGNNFGTVTADAAYADATNYAMDNTTSGNNVSSPYGDAVFASTAPVSNINVPMTFAAVAGQTTPAGLYKANMNLIATGVY